jgi:hypothetical protein
MKKTIIANIGRGSVGKSDTIKRVATNIIRKYPFSVTIPEKIDYSKDISVVIKIGEVSIAIDSEGDPNTDLKGRLNHFVKKECDIIICTARTSGATKNAIYDLQRSKGYEIVWTINFRSDKKNHNVLNEMSANNIIELVDEILKEKL